MCLTLEKVRVWVGEGLVLYVHDLCMWEGV